MIKEEIDFAVREEKRPPLYTAMKYWGKKPHNVWREYINTYTPKDGVFLDPFTGSAMSALEAYKVGKKAYAFDLNPLSSFVIEVYGSEFNRKKFLNAVNSIVSNVNQDRVYSHFNTVNCEYCGKEDAKFHHAKWDKKQIYEIGYICDSCGRSNKNKFLKSPDKMDVKKALDSQSINIQNWVPNISFYNSPSFSDNFKKNIGGHNFSDLWTKRNLYTLSLIFHEILKYNDEALKKQLLFGFIQSLHLCTKMCVPRRDSANRPFSTSWGRSAFLCSNRQMEMNPLYLFKNNSIGKQSVESALNNVQEYLGGTPKILDINSPEYDKSKESSFDIIYGIVNVVDLHKYIKPKSIDFIITDPPYGGLVQYLDLSSIWLIWLSRYDKKYKPSIKDEITIKKGINSIEDYEKRFTKAIQDLYSLLSDEGKIVFTFHNKDLNIWNAFLKSIYSSGFKIEKVIHQQNRRTGESNVANPYGTSASDFYIRCTKNSTKKLVNNRHQNFEDFIVKESINIINKRGQPTPYQVLFNGLLAELSQSGFNFGNFDNDIKTILSKHINQEFIITYNKNQPAGNFWYVKQEYLSSDYIASLDERVEETIKNLFEEKGNLTLDDILGEIYVKYPNGLTPDNKTINSILEKVAYKYNGKWFKR